MPSRKQRLWISLPPNPYGYGTRLFFYYVHATFGITNERKRVYKIWQPFQSYGLIINIAILGAWQMIETFSNRCRCTFFPEGSKFGLFLLYGEWFPGKWTTGYILALKLRFEKVPKAIHVHVFLPQGVPLGYFRVTSIGFCDTVIFDLQTWHIWAWNLKFEKHFRSCICSLYLPQRIAFEFIFAPHATISEIQSNFQMCSIWTYNPELEKSCRRCILTHFLLQ